jgi:hypothetical protein
MASEEPGLGQKYTILASKHITVLRHIRLDIFIEIRWCPAYIGVSVNEKAEEWVKLAAGTPNARGVEYLPRSLVHLKREIMEKKWAEARQWAGGWITNHKYKMPHRQWPDQTVARSTKRLALRFYQLKTGYYLSGRYLNWTKKRLTTQC